jgi:hypothetical protein
MVYLRRYGFDISNFDAYVLQHNSDRFYIIVYINNLILYGPSGYFIDTTILGLKIEFVVTNIGQFY